MTKLEPLTEKDKTILEKAEKEIQGMTFSPISDEEVQHYEKRYKQAITNNRLEGTYETSFNRKLHQLFLSHRVPGDLSTEIAVRLIKEQYSEME